MDNAQYGIEEVLRAKKLMLKELIEDLKANKNEFQITPEKLESLLKDVNDLECAYKAICTYKERIKELERVIKVNQEIYEENIKKLQDSWDEERNNFNGIIREQNLCRRSSFRLKGALYAQGIQTRNRIGS